MSIWWWILGYIFMGWATLVIYIRWLGDDEPATSVAIFSLWPLFLIVAIFWNLAKFLMDSATYVAEIDPKELVERVKTAYIAQRDTPDKASLPIPHQNSQRQTHLGTSDKDKKG
jgi:hypothetical protein